jgi:tetratricopeptide (TPR) repeat protein
MTMRKSFAALLAASLILAAVGAVRPAAAASGDAALEYVTRPGFEAAVERMLTAPSRLPAGWSAVGVSIERNGLLATYVGEGAGEGAGEGGPTVRVRLVHPSAAPPDALRTEQFALRFDGPAPPGGDALLAALVASVRAGEGEWRWEEVRRAPTEGPAGGVTAWEQRGLLDAVADAVAAAETGDRGRARELLERVAQQRAAADPARVPDDVDAVLGAAWLRLGDRERATAAFRAALDAAQAALQDRPAAFPARVLRARALAGLGELADPGAHVRELVAAAPDVASACALDQLGLDLSQLGRVDDAMAVFLGLLRAEPRCPPATWLRVSNEVSRLRRLSELGPLLEAAARLYPDDAAVIGPLANYYKWQEQYDKAIAVLEPLAQARNPQPGLLEPLLHTYALRGVTDAQIEDFAARSDADPTSGFSALYAGAFLHYRGDQERAIPFLERAVKALPREPRGFIYLAMSHHALGHSAEAQKYIELAESGGTSDPDVHYCRGRILMDVDPPRSVAEFDRYLWITHDQWGLPESKQERVRRTVVALRQCLDAPVPSRCVAERIDSVTASADAPPPAPPPARPSADWPGGRAPERDAVLALLRAEDGGPFDPGPGWTLAEPSVRAERVGLLLVHERGWSLELALSPAGSAAQPFAATASYDLVLATRPPADGSPEAQLLATVVAALRRNDPAGPDRTAAPAGGGPDAATPLPAPASAAAGAPAPAGRPGPSREAALGLLRGFTPGEGWTLGEPRTSAREIAFPFTHANGWRVDVVLKDVADDAGAAAKTRSFAVTAEIGSADPQAPERQLLGRVVAAVQANDDGALRLAAPERADSAPLAAGLLAQLGALRTLDLVQVVEILALLLLAAGFLVPVARRSARALVTLDRGDRLATLGFLGLGAALRIALPLRLVTIFMGYRAALEVAAFAEVPKYGSSAFVLHRLAFGLFGADHAVAVWLNVILGALTAPVLVALVVRLRPERWAATAVSALLALTPLFLKDHVSESNLVPLVFFLSCGLLLWDAWLAEHRLAELGGAVVFFALAATGRPEMLAIVPLAAVLLAWARGLRAGLGGQGLRPLAAALSLLALVVPHVVHLVYAVEYEVLTEGIPPVDGSLIGTTLGGLVRSNILLEPGLFPVALPLLALGAASFSPGRTRRLPIALLLLAVAWMASYFIDLPFVSIPRLHAPAATLVALAAGLGLAGLLRAAAARLPQPAARAAVVAVAVSAVVGSAVPGALALWRPTNEDEEERFLRAAFAALPEDAEGCLVRVDGQDDQVFRKIHRYHPDYLAPPRLRVLGIREWEQGGGRCPNGGRSWFLLSLRCYALPTSELGPSARPGIVSSCARLQRTGALTPILERDLANHGDNEFGYWPATPTFHVGLYEIATVGQAARQP